jgi:hypothetical protein
LLSHDLFTEVLAMGENVEGATAAEKLEKIRKNFLFQGNVVTDLSKWYIVSFRYNHCGDPVKMNGHALVSATGPCSAYLRVVAQPIGDSPIDSALHLIYNLGPSPTDKNNLILQKLLKLRDEAQKSGISTARRPLQTHPALVQALRHQEDQNHFGQKVAGFVHDILGSSPSSKLDMITMTATVNTMQWKFFGGLVQKDQSGSKLHWLGFNTAIFQGLEKFMPQSLICDGSAFCVSSPTTTNSEDPTFPSLFEIFREKNKEQSIPSKKYQEIAEIIDNPQKSNLLNTDCMSCHATASFRNKDELLIADQGFPRGITPFVSGNFLVGDTTAVINFGYKQTLPRIAVRTAAESAVVADAVNNILNTDNPGYNCPQEKQNELWACLMKPSKVGDKAISCYEQFCN